jgi:cytochrome c
MIASVQRRVIVDDNGKETRMLRWIVAAGAMIALPTLALAQDPTAAGEKIFKLKCSPCHTIGPGAKIKIGAGGPPLNGVIGRQAGTYEAFAYSPAMRNSGKTWDEATLKAYIADPKKEVPGNKMGFPGLKDELEIDDLYAYLVQFDAGGNKKQ